MSQDPPRRTIATTEANRNQDAQHESNLHQQAQPHPQQQAIEDAQIVSFINAYLDASASRNGWRRRRSNLRLDSPHRPLQQQHHHHHHHHRSHPHHRHSAHNSEVVVIDEEGEGRTEQSDGSIAANRGNSSPDRSEAASPLQSKKKLLLAVAYVLVVESIYSYYLDDSVTIFVLRLLHLTVMLKDSILGMISQLSRRRQPQTSELEENPQRISEEQENPEANGESLSNGASSNVENENSDEEAQSSAPLRRDLQGRSSTSGSSRTSRKFTSWRTSLLLLLFYNSPVVMAHMIGSWRLSVLINFVAPEEPTSFFMVISVDLLIVALQLVLLATKMEINSLIQSSPQSQQPQPQQRSGQMQPRTDDVPVDNSLQSAARNDDDHSRNNQSVFDSVLLSPHPR